jgi:C4-dicarboxylate-specific signal transduction histidine kinase
VTADPGRIAQVLANLVSNAARHGTGPVSVRGTRAGETVRIEIENGCGGPTARRGVGLVVAESAARDAGGRVRVRRGRDAVSAAIELPAAPVE